MFCALQVGTNVKGGKLKEGRDVWVVQLQGESGAANAAAGREEMFRRRVAHSETEGGPLHARDLTGLGTYLWKRARYEEALAEHAKALEIRRAALGDKHPNVGDTYYNMALAYEDCDKTAQARACYQSAAAVYEECYGPEHEETLDAQQQLRAL